MTELSQEAKDLIADREKETGSDFLDHPDLTPPAAAEAPPAAPGRPTVSQFGEKVVNAVKNQGSSPVAEWLNDPAHAAAVLGVPVGMYRSGANFNPANPTFLKSNPRPSTPVPRDITAGTAEPQTPVYDTPTGQASKANRTAGENMLTNQSANKSWASAPEGRIQTLNQQGVKGPSMNQLYSEMGPTEVKMIGGKPFEIPLGAANQPATEAAAESTPITNAIKNAFPGLSKAGQWISEVAPTLHTMGKSAGAFGGGFDTAARLMQGDTAGAGVSGVGTGLAGLAAFPEDVGIGGLAYLVNHFREHPEELKELGPRWKKMEENRFMP
jgi:hypothetical protein